MESPGSDNVSDIIFDLRYLLFLFVFLLVFLKKDLMTRNLQLIYFSQRFL